MKIVTTWEKAMRNREILNMINWLVLSLVVGSVSFAADTTLTLKVNNQSVENASKTIEVYNETTNKRLRVVRTDK